MVWSEIKVCPLLAIALCIRDGCNYHGCIKIIF